MYVCYVLFNKYSNFYFWAKPLNCNNVDAVFIYFSYFHMSYSTVQKSWNIHSMWHYDRFCGNYTDRCITLTSRRDEYTGWSDVTGSMVAKAYLTNISQYEHFSAFHLKDGGKNSYFSIRNGQPREPALCRLYWHTCVPCLPNSPKTPRSKTVMV